LSPLSCSLNQVSLFQAPSFVALSYCWGDLNDKIPIRVNDCKISVTVNLHAALRQLRAEKMKCVWVDFLCINQQDSEERSIQVGRIGTIYRRAEQVVVWLGDNQGIKEDDLASLSAEGTKTARHALSVSTRQTLIQLLSRPYWTRVWIIQELAAASSITIFCGRHKLSWEIFSNDSYTESVAVVDKTTNNELETKFQKICQFRMDKVNREPIRLLDALHRSQFTLSTDPRDKLYALLGLAFDSDRFIPEPNYHLSKEETYTDFSLALIENKFPLDFIYLRSSNRQVYDSLPSWVVDWSDLNDALAREEFGHIMRLKSILLTPHVNEKKPAHSPKNTLIIQGFILGSIDGLSSTFFADKSSIVDMSILRKAALVQSDCSSYIFNTLSEPHRSSYIFNTLFETQRLSALGIIPVPSSIRLWSFITRTSLEVLFNTSILPTELRGVLDWFDENRSLAAFGSTMEYWNSTWTTELSLKYLSPLQSTWLCSLVRTIMSSMRIAILESGQLGWVHAQSQKGDKVAKIIGCNRHVVLRPHSKGYQVIGEARLCWLAGEPEFWDETRSLSLTIV
jgi:hypothetical protein